jgi:hypothetical protein
MRKTLLLSALVASLAVATASAQSSSFGGSPLLSSPVPVNSLARMSSWIDPQRMHISTSVSVGSGFGVGGGTQALQVTSLSYQFRAPIALSVSLGNAWGANATSSNGNAFFLEGLRMAWQPSSSTAFSFEYRQLRSPLQYGSGYGYGYRGQPLLLP